MAEGIEVRTAKDGTRSYRAAVWSNRDRKRIRRTFPTMAAAKGWRRDALGELEKGRLRPPDPTRVREAASAFLEGAECGTIRDRSGRPYKPSTIRSYRRALDLRLLPALGHYRLTELRRPDIQALIDSLAAEGLSASTIRNTLDPLRAIFRRALSRDLVAVNPTLSLELPAPDGGRQRIASAAEAEALLAALRPTDRALWATALYAGLRRGELRGLRVSDVDLGRCEIHVQQSWDEVHGPIEPKSSAGSRVIPLLALLRDYLDEHLLSLDRGGDELVFGRTPTAPFVASTVRARALADWAKASLPPIGLHECRHTFASLLIDAGSNAKAVQEFMGHATIQMTFDRYGHLMPGRREEVRRRVDQYLSPDLITQ